MLSVSGVNNVFIHKINIHCLCPEFFGVVCLAWCYNLDYFISSECLISFIAGKKDQVKNDNLHTPIFSMLNLAKTISCGNKWP